jgi:dolichol-phosphate mannosyltransferase
VRLSVTIPLYNEDEVFPELLRRLQAVLDAIPGGPHEVVFVDDGSTDKTPEVLAQACARDSRIVAVSLSRNFGHQAAVSAALDNSRGDAVVVMDGDLQDPPEEIPRLLGVLQSGNDVVYARRVGRKESWAFRLSYYVFYRLINALSAVRLPLDTGDFAILSRRVVDQIRDLREHHRYLRGLRTWVGFRQVGVDVERAPRQLGKPKYSVRRLFRLAFDGIFAFSLVPLRAAAYLGILTILAALGYSAYALYERLFLGSSPRGFTGLLIVITLLSGIQLLFLGVIGEYLGRVYEETKNRPHYVIARILGRSDGVPGSRKS